LEAWPAPTCFKCFGIISFFLKAFAPGQYLADFAGVFSNGHKAYIHTYIHTAPEVSELLHLGISLS
jgi:hypothetical protein